MPEDRNNGPFVFGTVLFLLNFHKCQKDRFLSLYSCHDSENTVDYRVVFVFVLKLFMCWNILQYLRCELSYLHYFMIIYQESMLF